MVLSEGTDGSAQAAGDLGGSPCPNGTVVHLEEIHRFLHVELRAELNDIANFCRACKDSIEGMPEEISNLVRRELISSHELAEPASSGLALKSGDEGSASKEIERQSQAATAKRNKRFVQLPSLLGHSASSSPAQWVCKRASKIDEPTMFEHRLVSPQTAVSPPTVEPPGLVLGGAVSEMPVVVEPAKEEESSEDGEEKEGTPTHRTASMMSCSQVSNTRYSGWRVSRVLPRATLAKVQGVLDDCPKTNSKVGAWKRGLTMENDFCCRKSLWSESGERQWNVMLHRLVASDQFNILVVLLVICSSAQIGVETDYAARFGSNAEAPSGLVLVERCFCVLFTIEITLRLLVSKGLFFYGPGFVWNIFDFVFVVSQIVDNVCSFLDLGQTGVSLGGMKVLRLTRAIRIVRLMRIIRLLGELRKIVYLIAGAMQAFMWTLMLILLLVYATGIMLTQLVVEFRHPGSAAEEGLYPHWGSLSTSCLTLFQAITGGMDWSEVVTPLSNHVSLPGVEIIFSFYISFGVLVMLNLVTGVFVESAQRILKADSVSADLAKVTQLFHDIDVDCSGEIDWREFQKKTDSLEFQEKLTELGLSLTEMQRLFSVLDHDGSGFITIEEFVQGCSNLRSNATVADMADLMSDIHDLKTNWTKQAAYLESMLSQMVQGSNGTAMAQRATVCLQ